MFSIMDNNKQNIMLIINHTFISSFWMMMLAAHTIQTTTHIAKFDLSTINNNEEDEY